MMTWNRIIAVKDMRSGQNLDIFWNNMIGEWLDVGEKLESRMTVRFSTWATGRMELSHNKMGSLWEEQVLSGKIRDSALASVSCCFSYLLYIWRLHLTRLKSIESFLSPKDTNVQLKTVTAELVWAYHTNERSIFSFLLWSHGTE